ncbi:MAG: nicotinamide-nucleotide amidohydrolase family protein [Treponema sp.]|jgi:PncC family amidohydrolase|nr:nicotinamide-nucleotide amidohydrolase family protein [Treponema sp.]
MEEFELNAMAEKAAELLIRKLSADRRTLALAESCTAGLVSALLARVPGASSVLWGSFVCYTREAKAGMLDIDREKLAPLDLVSEKTASLMAAGALGKSGVDAAAAVTGLAGPEGDGSAVPVGTVWVAAAVRDSKAVTREFHFTGSRNEIRLHAAIAVLESLQSVLT